MLYLQNMIHLSLQRAPIITALCIFIDILIIPLAVLYTVPSESGKWVEQQTGGYVTAYGIAAIVIVSGLVNIVGRWIKIRPVLDMIALAVLLGALTYIFTFNSVFLLLTPGRPPFVPIAYAMAFITVLLSRLLRV